MNYLLTSYGRCVNAFYVRRILFLCSLAWCCSISYGQTTTVNYTPSAVDIANPERGIYHFTETHSNAYAPLNTATLSSFRTSENITMIIRNCYLEDFVNAPISANYLSLLQTDFNNLRNAGLKCILRFSYTDQTVGWPPASPYGDATKAWMLSHIAQLEPYLQNNSDVIAVVQAGFIGVWGEWYYTTNFGDPLNGNPTAANYADRKEVLDRLLAAVPADRMIQVRTPYYKYRLYRSNVLTPLSAAEAFNGSAVARIGHHNDCYLASSTDFGTYANTTTEYPFLAADTKYVPMGGETCQLNAPRTNCTGDALNEFSLFHWSLINQDYINTVWDAWNTQGCYADIKRNLGYRIQLNNGSFSTAVKPGGSMNITLSLTNTGWASMYNPRLLEFVLINTSDGKVCKATTNEEPRKWAAGSTLSLTYEIGIPANYPNGTYKVLMSLPDPKTNLYEKAAYSVRLANGNTTWDNVKGYNYLGFDLTVDNTLSAPTYTGSSWFSSCYGALPLEWLDFSGAQEEDKTHLIWHTAHEVGTDHFEVQKSSDGQSFINIGQVASSASSAAINTYTFNDQFLTGGVAYYRIAQYDKDGNFSFSKIVSTYHASIRKLYASPNPFTDEVKLFLEGFEGEEVSLHVQDVNGKNVLEQILRTGLHSISIGKDFILGVYLVSITSSTYSLYTKIVKLGE
jgi:hypothetical protein